MIFASEHTERISSTTADLCYLGASLKLDGDILVLKTLGHSTTPCKHEDLASLNMFVAAGSGTCDFKDKNILDPDTIVFRMPRKREKREKGSCSNPASFLGATTTVTILVGFRTSTSESRVRNIILLWSIAKSCSKLQHRHVKIPCFPSKPPFVPPPPPYNLEHFLA